MTDDVQEPANTGRDHAGRFLPGSSGNPHGKPKGARHRTTQAIEALLEGQAHELTQKAISLALAGDTTALRLCIERLAPTPRERTIQFDLPPIEGPQDAPAAMLTLLKAVAEGLLTPGEAEGVGKLLDGYRRSVELADLETRITALETANARRA